MIVCYTAVFSVVTHGALRDDAKNGCVADYAVDGGSRIIGSHVARLILYTSLSLVCISDRSQRCLRKKPFFTTASAIISYLARKGELLFTNSDQIEAND